MTQDRRKDDVALAVLTSRIDMIEKDFREEKSKLEKEIGDLKMRLAGYDGNSTIVKWIANSIVAVMVATIAAVSAKLLFTGSK